MHVPARGFVWASLRPALGLGCQSGRASRFSALPCLPSPPISYLKIKGKASTYPPPRRIEMFLPIQYVKFLGEKEKIKCFSRKHSGGWGRVPQSRFTIFFKFMNSFIELFFVLMIKIVVIFYEFSKSAGYKNRTLRYFYITSVYTSNTSLQVKVIEIAMACSF